MISVLSGFWLLDLSCFSNGFYAYIYIFIYDMFSFSFGCVFFVLGLYFLVLCFLMFCVLFSFLFFFPSDIGYLLFRLCSMFLELWAFLIR